MSALPMTWCRAQIGDLCELINGRAFKPTDWTKAGLPIVRIQNLNNKEAKFNYFDGDVRERFLINEGDLLFAWSGTPGTSFGAHVWSGGRAVLNQHIFNVVYKAEAIDRDFFRYAINQKLEELIGKAHGGVGLRHVTKGKFEETRIELPPLPEQRRIVAKLDSLRARSGSTRDELARIPFLIEHYKQAILQKAFTGAFAGSISTGKTPLRNYISSLDQGWSPKCEAFASDNPEKWAVIKTTAIQPFQFFKSENKVLPNNLTPRAHIQIEEKDILITRAGPRSRVGITCLVTESRPKLMLCDKAYRLRVKKDEADPAFVMLMLNAPQALSQIEDMKTGISDSGLNLTQTKLLDLTLPALTLEQQQHIVRMVKAALAWLDIVKAEQERASQLLGPLDQGILTKAFSGELVPQDPGDEPADKLLERIRMGAPSSRGCRGRRSRAGAAA